MHPLSIHKFTSRWPNAYHYTSKHRAYCIAKKLVFRNCQLIPVSKEKLPLHGSICCPRSLLRFLRSKGLFVCFFIAVFQVVPRHPQLLGRTLKKIPVDTSEPEHLVSNGTKSVSSMLQDLCINENGPCLFTHWNNEKGSLVSIYTSWFQQKTQVLFSRKHKYFHRSMRTKLQQRVQVTPKVMSPIHFHGNDNRLKKRTITLFDGASSQRWNTNFQCGHQL